jgi:hypothetical protein
MSGDERLTVYRTPRGPEVYAWPTHASFATELAYAGQGIEVLDGMLTVVVANGSARYRIIRHDLAHDALEVELIDFAAVGAGA